MAAVWAFGFLFLYITRLADDLVSDAREGGNGLERQSLMFLCKFKFCIKTSVVIYSGPLNNI